MLNHVGLFVASWAVACQTLSIGFSKQEYWSGLPFPSPTHLNSACTCSHRFFISFHVFKIYFLNCGKIHII